MRFPWLIFSILVWSFRSTFGVSKAFIQCFVGVIMVSMVANFVMVKILIGFFIVIATVSMASIA